VIDDPSLGGPDPDPHRRTLDVYESSATRWERERGVPQRAMSAAFGRRWSEKGGVVADLGCGPGWHLPDLPPGAIAFDGARAMLDIVPNHSPTAPRVQGDLRALPFARHSLDGAWAERSYVHLDRRACPVAWWDLHRVLKVGAVAHLGLFTSPIDTEFTTRGPSGPSGPTDRNDHGPYPGDDFPGRSFSHWDPTLLDSVLEGAGFSIIERDVDAERDQVSLSVRRERTLADLVGPDMRLLIVGLNPSVYAADVGVGFGRPGNRAWPALLGSGLATVDRDPLDLLRSHRIGMTDLVKRATAKASELSPAEFRHGFDRLDALCTWLQPGAICVLGVTGWRTASGDRTAQLGLQDRTLGGRPVYVMPNPSGLNAHTNVEDLIHHLHAALDLAGR